MTVLRPWLGVLAIAGCAREPEPSAPSVPETSTATSAPTTPPARSVLTPDELLTRISLDLRGIRPSIEELQAYDGQPEVLEADIDAYLHDPHLHQRAADFYSEVLPSRIGDFYVDLDVAFARQYSIPVLTAHVAEEPLQMFAHVVDHDLPYSAIVHGNWTIADELLAGVFPLDYPAGATGWREATYTDGRPGVGILSTNGLWWFKGSNINNKQRIRGNLVSSMLLCSDFLDRELPFSNASDLTSEEALDDAVREDPACKACHDDLDPLSSHFWGFYYGDGRDDASFFRTYHADQEDFWKEDGDPPPGFFGKPSAGLAELGDLVTADPRFSSCFVQESWKILSRTDASELGLDLGRVQQAFDDSGGNVRETWRAIVNEPAYQGYDPRLAKRLVPPQILSTMVQDLTGYQWLVDGVDQLDSGYGYALLAGTGGGDSDPAQMSTVASAFVIERLAQAASRYVVEGDQQRTGADRVLFAPDFDFADTTDDASGAARVRAEIQRLLFRMLGRDLAADDPEVQRFVDLWSAAWAASHDRTETWSAVIGAVLRHPDMVTY